MSTIIEKGHFNSYKISNLSDVRAEIRNVSAYDKKINVFLSHKHDDLDELKGLIGFLEKTYGIRCYIDSREPNMPESTTGETAKQLKDRIKICDKFILLATNGAISSKWCNWELGYGDSQKYPNNIAILPMISKGIEDFKGSEYMSIYPYIIYHDGTAKYTDGTNVEQGYYVKTIEKGKGSIEPLSKWLRRR